MHPVRLSHYGRRMLLEDQGRTRQRHIYRNFSYWDKPDLIESRYNCATSHNAAFSTEVRVGNMVSITQSRVLLLNGSTWEPLAVVSLSRAINLVLSEKAVIVEQTGEFLRTVRTNSPCRRDRPAPLYHVPRRQAHWSRKAFAARHHVCFTAG